MVEIRRPNGRKPFKSNSTSSLSSVPKIVIGVLVVLFLGTTLSSLSKTATTPNDRSISKPSPALGLEGQLKDSRGNLRPKPAQPYGKSIPIQIPNSNSKTERIQEDHEEDPDHDVDPADENRNEEESSGEASGESVEESSEESTEEPGHDSELEKNHPDKSSDKDDKDSSNDPDEEAPELPDENHHEDAEEKQTDVDVVKKQKQKKPPIPGAANFEAATARTGTGPTKTAYVKDFRHERANPAFRIVAMEEASSSLLAEIAKMVDESSVTPCITTTTKTDPKCSDTDTPLIVYNSASFERTWCGTKVAPMTAVKVAGDCDRSQSEKEPTHLFPVDFPPISGQGMAPIVLKSHLDVIVDAKDLKEVECNIPCQQEKGMNRKTLVIDGTHWSMTHAETMERINFRHDKYYSTQSWLSDVPLSMWDFSKYSMRRPAVDWDKTPNKGVYMESSACSSKASNWQNNNYFSATALKIKVDAVGTCQHNADVPKGLSMDTIEGRVAIMKKYRIALAFDSTTEKDHISGIIWEAYMSGAVPVVVGADNLMSDHHLPPHSAIIAAEFDDWDAMADYVKQVAENKTLWESYHTWRKDESLISAFEEKYQFTKTNPTCRMCRWAYAKKFGLGWDHGKQEVVEAKLPRQLCSSNNNKGLVSKPFEEGWIHRSDQQETAELIVHDEGGGATSDTSTCTSVTTVEGTIDTDTYKIHRTIHQHDSITDSIITGVEREDHEGQVILRLEFPGVRNSEGALFRNTHTLVPTKRGAFASSATMQDEFVKVTILADWVTSISSPQEGVMEIVVQRDKEDAMPEGTTKRIRVFTEGLNVIHDKMSEYFPSSFAKVVTKDFIDPLELFYADS
jgi:hypothetical protein